MTDMATFFQLVLYMTAEFLISPPIIYLFALILLAGIVQIIKTLMP